MPRTVCPKCGFQQEGGDECGRCGVIYARFHRIAADERAEAYQETYEFHDSTRPGLFRRMYRIFRWVALAALVAVLVLILRPTPPPAVLKTPGDVERAAAKMRQFQTSARRGNAETLQMDESELNGWLGANLALERPEATSFGPPGTRSASPLILAQMVMAPKPSANPSMEEVQSSVRDVRIKLYKDSILAYVSFELYGMDMSLELEGTPVIQDGCLRLNLTGGKLGSLPLPSGTLGSAEYRLFDTPENREKFRLPPEINDIHIERKQLIVSTR